MNKIPLLHLEQEIKELKNFNKNILSNNNLITTRSLSLKSFSDFTQIWLDYNKTNSSINGLISNDTVAGIVILKENQALGLLNQNIKCNYGVFIGKSNAPGITHGIKNQINIKIKYIPTWYNINIGDEVITSGMDNIFFKGLKVGRVLSIKRKKNSLEAIVKPYSHSSIKQYYHIYKYTR
jgi:rod shape-determining protein MreC